KVLLTCLATFQFFPLLCPAFASTTDFVVYDKQAKRLLPKIRIENRDYLSIIELLQILDLPYSESASSGFFIIEAGKNKVKLTKDRNTALVNEATVALNAPVVVTTQGWLASPDFVGRVLSRVLSERVTVSASGNRFLIGAGSFNRLDVKGFASEQNSTVVV